MPSLLFYCLSFLSHYLPFLLLFSLLFSCYRFSSVIISCPSVTLSINFLSFCQCLVTSTTTFLNTFYFRPGSVVATFHIEITGSNCVPIVQQLLGNATINGTLGVFKVNASLLNVREVVNGKQKFYKFRNNYVAS